MTKESLDNAESSVGSISELSQIRLLDLEFLRVEERLLRNRREMATDGLEKLENHCQKLLPAGHSLFFELERLRILKNETYLLKVETTAREELYRKLKDSNITDTWLTRWLGFGEGLQAFN